MLTNGRSGSKNIFAILEKDHKETFKKLNRFYEVLRNLRFEGKQSVGKNVSEVQKLASYFKGKIKEHMREEERTLFPFLKAHIPRLEPMICLLLSEHEDFRNSLRDLARSLSEFKKPGRDKDRLIHGLSEKGTYLIFLLRSHMRVESLSLYRVADKELNRSEKKQLLAQIGKDVTVRCRKMRRVKQ